MKITIKENGKEREVELSEESAHALKKAFTEEKKGLWKPEMGEEYWDLGFDGSTHYGWRWENLSWEEKAYLRGNVFPTEEAAEKEDEKRKAIHRVKQYIAREFGVFGPSREELNQNKYLGVYLPYWDVEEKCMVPMQQSSRYFHYSPFNYLRSAEDCDQLITDMEDDLKIIFEIE